MSLSQNAAEAAAKMIAVGRYSQAEQQSIAWDACQVCGVPVEEAGAVLAKAKILAAELRAADAELKKQVTRTIDQFRIQS